MTDDQKRKRLARLASGSLLLATRRTETLLREAARPHVRDAARRVTGDETPTQSARSLLAVSGAMVPALALAVIRGRKLARRAATARLVAELDATGQGLVRGGQAAAKLSVAAMAEDEVAAQSVAESLAIQWRQVAQGLLMAGRDRVDPKVAVERSERAFRPRLVRVSTTETAVAYQDEHRARLALAVRQGEVDSDRLMLEWSALTDACPRCRPLHGERVRVGESFSTGDRPGSVHVNCSCVELVVLV